MSHRLKHTSSNKKARFPLLLFNENFFGVLLRNLPKEIICEEITNFLWKQCIKAEVQPINELRGEFFTLVKVDTLVHSSANKGKL